MIQLPTHERIAAELVRHPAILSLRTRRLEADVRALFGIGGSTARSAIAIARERCSVRSIRA
jgi:hypothetical protein